MNKELAWRAISNVLVGIIIALALFLAASKLPIPGNYKILTVLSGSMEPAVKTGAVVVVKPAPEYKIGDIITFTNTGDARMPVTHRIVAIDNSNGEQSFITKGDANEEADSRKVALNDIIGKLLFSIPFLGYVLEFLKQPQGFLLVIVLPAAAIIIDESVKIVKQLRS